MKTSFWPTHLYSLDVSRGIAALSVVLWHWRHFAYAGTSLFENTFQEDQPIYGILKIFYEKGWLGVEYFFLLSGFIFFWLYHEKIKNRIFDIKRFFILRFSRLYPLHFVTLLIVAILQYFYIKHNGDSFVYPYNDFYHFLLNVVFATSWGFEKGYSFNAPIWSVSIEMLLYAIFYLVAFFQLGGGVFCVAVSFCSFILYTGVVQYEVFSGLSMFFLGGAVFYLTKQIVNNHTAFKRPFYIGTIVAWLSVIISFYFFDFSNLIMRLGIVGKIFLFVFPSYILFPLTILSLALLEIDKRMSLKSISWLGGITYSSYLLHFPLQLIFMFAVSYGLIEKQFFLSPFYLVVFFVLLIGISNLTYRGFEMPMQKMIRSKFNVHRNET